MDVATRHGFLAELHRIVKPSVYLEIGVQFGHSLRLAAAAPRAIGIDPAPQAQAYVHLLPNHQIYPMTSDEFFDQVEPPPIDLAFIDGLHLFEAALRDLANVEQHAAPGAVAVLDDVLPRNEVEASREANPGDWAGDVWKVPMILPVVRPHLLLTLVDVQPTGLLVVERLDPDHDYAGSWADSHQYDHFWKEMSVTDSVLTRFTAISPRQALREIEERRT